ncbi:MAG: IS91 family transposase, partial [Hyphomicrobiales bacterium]|nr:IS91 family transposase [Hyphomicrobiales bacterium]
RFLLPVLPSRFHRIRHYGLFANGNRAANLAQARELLAVPEPETEPQDNDEQAAKTCPCCGGHMVVIESFEPGCKPRRRPPPEGIDSS